MPGERILGWAREGSLRFRALLLGGQRGCAARPRRRRAAPGGPGRGGPGRGDGRPGHPRPRRAPAPGPRAGSGGPGVAGARRRQRAGAALGAQPRLRDGRVRRAGRRALAVLRAPDPDPRRRPPRRRGPRAPGGVRARVHAAASRGRRLDPLRGVALRQRPRSRQGRTDPRRAGRGPGSPGRRRRVDAQGGGPLAVRAGHGARRAPGRGRSVQCRAREPGRRSRAPRAGGNLPAPGLRGRSPAMAGTCTSACGAATRTSPDAAAPLRRRPAPSWRGCTSTCRP